MGRSLSMGLLLVVMIVGLGTVAVGLEPAATIHFVPPGILPPIIIRSTDADVNGDGRVTVDDVKLLYSPSREVKEKFIRPFYEKLLVAGKQYQPEWNAVEYSRKNVRDLAVAMVTNILNLESEKKAGQNPVESVCVLTYWAGEKVSGWSILTPGDLEQIRTGKARFSIDEHSQHWKLVYNLMSPVRLGLNVS